MSEYELPPDARRLALTALSRRPRGLFTDVDGTISALAPTPEAAVLLPGIQPLLIEALAAFDLVAAVSGRAARDARRLVGIPALLYAGNHGMERLEPSTSGGTAHTRVTLHPAARAYRSAITRGMDEVDRTLSPRFPGLRVERKGVTGTIHVRNTPNPLAAEEAVMAAVQDIASAAGLRVTRGKMVVELRPPVNVDKGTLVTELVRDRALASAFYLGDDVTDIDAFRALRGLTAKGVCQGVAVAVVQSEAPGNLALEADIVLDGVALVPDFLRWVLAHA